MKTRNYRTSEIARAAGVHPNTVRVYEKWGFLPPVPRNASGYRIFTEDHLDQMLLARMALLDGWPGREMRRTSLLLIRQAAEGELKNALEQAHHYLDLVRSDRRKAEDAVKLLEIWAEDTVRDDDAEPLRIGEAAELLEVSVDMLRHWERNGLIKVPQNPRNRYRLYGKYEIRRLRIIHVLSRAGYSTMAILRMLLHLDRGNTGDLRHVLDTPGPDEDIYSAADQWLSTLIRWEQRILDMINHLEKMIYKRQSRPPNTP